MCHRATLKSFRVWLESFYLEGFKTVIAVIINIAASFLNIGIKIGI